MFNDNTTVLEHLPAQVLTDKRLRFLDSHIDHFNGALRLNILSTHVLFPLRRSLHGSIVVYSTVFLGNTSPNWSSGILYLSATLMKQHCSACVLPGSPGRSPGNSIEYPVDKISFLSASTRTAPTQNLVGAGGPVKTQNLYLLDAQSFETSNKYNVKDVVAVSPGLDDALAPSLIVEGQGVQEVDWSSSTPAPGRHFFIPYDWVAGSRDVICAVLRRDIIFARNDDLVIIRRGFDFTAEIHLKE
ncbi:vegetative incompatibility protein HET-E-1 [Aspergillus udagawae]|nr:vegetative incompatibility protein HET-E-1 [Aspergillus udagawae]